MATGAEEKDMLSPSVYRVSTFVETFPSNVLSSINKLVFNFQNVLAVGIHEPLRNIVVVLAVEW